MEALGGGTQRHLIDLVRHVPGFQHVVAVPTWHAGTPTTAAIDALKASGARVEPVELGRSFRPLTNVRSLWQVRAIVRRERPALVHGHSSIGGAVARLACAGLPVPVAYTPNGIVTRSWERAIERLLRKRTGCFIAVSPSEGELALRLGLCSPANLVVIPNGIDLNPPAPLVPSLRDRLGIDAAVPLVGCVGRLTRQKAPEVYVSMCREVASSVPAAHFVLVGSGPLERELAGWVAADGLGDRFQHVRLLPGLAGSLGEMDVCVLPSRFEGGPYTPLECMRAGTPVVVTDAVGNRDVVEHDVTGLRAPVDDVPGLAAAVPALLTDPERARRLAAAAFERLPAFDVKVMGAATAATYQRLVRGAIGDHLG